MPDTTRHPSGGAMSEGSHLSIGEVLALLLEEFPDVTISKIRFLESQGLIDPERTPSGYRKFFDPDVERLRMILREQRENYLPLRVIKDRIDSGTLETAEQPVPRGIRNVEPGEQDRQVAAGSAVALADAGSSNDPEDDGPSGGRAREPSADADADDPEPDVPPDAGNGNPSSGNDGEPVPPADTPPKRSKRRPAAVTAEATSEAAAQLLPGVTLTLDELAGMVGATHDEITQLEEYGVIAGRESLGETVFDDDAVEISSIAVEFLRLGVDARHLRGWRTSADREASVYEQLILPLLRQRNPEGRQAARDQLQQMAELGGRLRASLMRAALRTHLG
jgi:DNA-binding transcriptional MerR regulator